MTQPTKRLKATEKERSRFTNDYIQSKLKECLAKIEFVTPLIMKRLESQ